MRISNFLLALPLAVAACLPSGPYTVIANPDPQPVLTPPPPPPPPRVTPLEITVVRQDANKLLLQTNRYAYVALFEIVPQRGVALVYPASTHQSTAQLSGLSWVNVWWTMRTQSDNRYSTASQQADRYVYALASDVPLRITESAYDANYMRRLLGPAAYEASNPTVTVRALSRYFAPSVAPERWGEDLYAIQAPSYRGTQRVARVYCADGSMFEVREDMANRAWCPPRRGYPRGGSGGQQSAPVASAPDSVVGPSGGFITRRQFDPRDPTPVFRVPADVVRNDPPAQTPKGMGTGTDRGTPTTGGNYPGTSGNNPGNNGNSGNGNNGNGNNGKGDKEHDDNGRRAHGDPANADPRGRGVGRGNGGAAGNPGNGNAGHGNPGNGNPGNGNPGNGNPGNCNPANTNPGNANPGNGNPGNGQANNPGNSGNQQTPADVTQQAKPRLADPTPKPEHADSADSSKEKPNAKPKQEDPRDKVNEMLRRAGMRPTVPKVQPKPDSSATQPPKP